MVSPTTAEIINGNSIAAAPQIHSSSSCAETSYSNKANEIGQIAYDKIVIPTVSAGNKVIATLKDIQSRWLNAKTIPKVIGVGLLILGGAIALANLPGTAVNPVVNGPHLNTSLTNLTHQNECLPPSVTAQNILNHSFTQISTQSRISTSAPLNDRTHTIADAPAVSLPLIATNTSQINMLPISDLPINPDVLQPAEKIKNEMMGTTELPSENPNVLTTNLDISKPLPDVQQQQLATQKQNELDCEGALKAALLLNEVARRDYFSNLFNLYISPKNCKYTAEQLEPLIPFMPFERQAEMLEQIVDQRIAQGNCNEAFHVADKAKQMSHYALFDRVYRHSDCSLEAKEHAVDTFVPRAANKKEYYEQLISQKLAAQDCKGAIATLKKLASKAIPFKQFDIDACSIDEKKQVLDLMPDNANHLKRREVNLESAKQKLTQGDLTGALETVKKVTSDEKDVILNQIFDHPGCDMDLKIKVIRAFASDRTADSANQRLFEELTAKSEPDFAALISVAQQSISSREASKYVEFIIKHPLSTQLEKEQAANSFHDEPVSRQFFGETVKSMLAEPQPDFMAIVDKSKHIYNRSGLLWSIANNPLANVYEREYALDKVFLVDEYPDTKNLRLKLISLKLNTSDFEGAAKTARKVGCEANTFLLNEAKTSESLAFKESVADAMDPHCITSHPFKVYDIISEKYRESGNSTEAARVAAKVKTVVQAYGEDGLEIFNSFKNSFLGWIANVF